MDKWIEIDKKLPDNKRIVITDNNNKIKIINSNSDIQEWAEYWIELPRIPSEDPLSYAREIEDILPGEPIYQSHGNSISESDKTWTAKFYNNLRISNFPQTDSGYPVINGYAASAIQIQLWRLLGGKINLNINTPDGRTACVDIALDFGEYGVIVEFMGTKWHSIKEISNRAVQLNEIHEDIKLLFILGSGESLPSISCISDALLFAKHGKSSIIFLPEIFSNDDVGEIFIPSKDISKEISSIPETIFDFFADRDDHSKYIFEINEIYNYLKRQNKKRSHSPKNCFMLSLEDCYYLDIPEFPTIRGIRVKKIRMRKAIEWLEKSLVNLEYKLSAFKSMDSSKDRVKRDIEIFSYLIESIYSLLISYDESSNGKYDAFSYGNMIVIYDTGLFL
jgi:hypothetical protein